MKSRMLLEIAKTQFDLSFSMLEKMIDQCPEDLWNEKKGGFVFWQQLLHAFTGMNFWMRQEGGHFVEPFAGRNVHPELDQEPEAQLTRGDLLGYKDAVKAIAEAFFEEKDDDWLGERASVYDKIRNLDVIFMQVRHIQYHVGHCNSILRENGREAVAWLDYYGE